MKTRSPLLSALILVLGASIFLTGMWVGRRMTSQVPAVTAAQPGTSIEQPQKPESPSAGTPPAIAKSAIKPIKPSSTKPTVTKVTVSDKEYARGKVIDPAGKPRAGAEVTIGGAWVTHAVTDSDGKFRIEVPQLEWKPGG